MNSSSAYRLDRVGVVDVTGDDRDAIVHNLTTNEIKSLSIDQGCETFITDVRGKMLAHVMLYRLPDRLRMIGPSGASSRIVQHVDRYTIREDALAMVRDDHFGAVVLTADAAAHVFARQADADQIERRELKLGEIAVEAYSARWLGDGTMILLAPEGEASAVAEHLSQHGAAPHDEAEFHAMRIEAGFPWYGTDLDETNLPQEADRDRFAVSFTKGCYLGQETVARLDALGKVQRKLVVWAIEGDAAHRARPGATLESDGKTVGRLTSVANRTDGTTIAIGFARRSHFDAGSVAKGTDEVSGDVYNGRVIN